jgi:hypothetical protein
MHSVALFASIVAVAAPALAQVLVPTPWFSEPYFPQEASEYIGAGKPYTINWDASELGNWPIRVDLLGGDDEASLHEVTFIASKSQ